MKQSWLKKTIIRSLLALTLLVGGVTAPQADPAQYFYDELGRIIGVSDSQGNTTVYSYDSVGNLLFIQNFSASTNGLAIYFFIPVSGPTGTSVEIHGNGFDPVASNNQVGFNGISATVLSSTSNVMVAVVPSNATTGPISIVNKNGTATSSKPFTVISSPAIQGIDPNRVPQGSTNYALISGIYLDNASSVKFSNTAISATILTGSTSNTIPIKFVVSSSVPVGSYTFTVITPNYTVQSGTITVTVTPPVQSYGTGQLTVYMPYPSNGPVSGGSSATSGLSVLLPFSSPFLPSGSSVSVAPPESVSMP